MARVAKDDEDDDPTTMWREHKAIRQQKRADNREGSGHLLRNAGITFVQHTEAHFTVGDTDPYDFWPGTGLFINRKTKKRGRGVMRLMKLVRKSTKSITEEQP